MAASFSLHEVMLMFCVLSTGSNSIYDILLLINGFGSWVCFRGLKSSVSMFLYL